MKRALFVVFLVFSIISVIAQKPDSLSNFYTNSADNLLLNNNKLVVGGYAEVHYNQPFKKAVYSNGVLDVHRVVMLFGYNFNRKTQFITELEFEHVKEVYVEQAFLQYKLNRLINLRGGLILVPMGIVNEFHEPTTFNGVERPMVDNIIVPTTWREIGFGATGTVLPAYLKYQVYILNGFNGFDGKPHISGKYGLRKGRQKGAESFISSPNLASKIEFFGIKGLNLGLAGYAGKTQSTLYDGLVKNESALLQNADSSVVGISMIGLDARYRYKALQLRGQYYYGKLSNTEQYNVFTASEDGLLNDVGNAMTGYYTEAGYDLLRSHQTAKQLVLFLRYEFLNTHQSVDNLIEKNPSYEKSILTMGITLGLTNNAVVKTDFLFVKDGNSNKYSNVLNVGFGVMF